LPAAGQAYLPFDQDSPIREVRAYCDPVGWPTERSGRIVDGKDNLTVMGWRLDPL
jgi:hypothetical protein